MINLSTKSLFAHLCLSFFLVGCGAENATSPQSNPAEPTSGTAPVPTAEAAHPANLALPITTKDIMIGAIEPSSNAIWAIGLDENIPQTEEAWKNVEFQAIQLLAATAAIAQGGSGPRDKNWAEQASWQVMTQEMSRIANDILLAAKSRDYDATLEASNYLVEPCGACHNAFPGDSTL